MNKHNLALLYLTTVDVGTDTEVWCVAHRVSEIELEDALATEERRLKDEEFRAIVKVELRALAEEAA